MRRGEATPARLDAHQHFWRYSSAEYDWIDGSMNALARDFLPEHLAPELAARALDGCIAVQARTSFEENDFLLALAAEHDFIRGVVGWIDFLAPDVAEHVERLSKHPKLCGFRHVVQAESDDFLARPDFTRGVRALAGHEFAYDILIRAQQLPAAVVFARALEGQRLVLDHVAKPPIASGELEPWASDLRALATVPRVWCKVSGLITEADRQHWTPEDLRPYLDVVFDAFGTDRLLFGSDWPVCQLAGSYARVFQVLDDYTAALSKDERAALFGRNAQAAYGLA